MLNQIYSLVLSLQMTDNYDSIQSNLAIEDIYFKNFKGVTSSKYAPKVGTIVCSSPEVRNPITTMIPIWCLTLQRSARTSMPVTLMSPALMEMTSSLAPMSVYLSLHARESY